MRKLLIGGRGIDASDLNLPERSVDFNVDTLELGNRADGAEQALDRIHNELSALLAQPDTVKLDQLRDSVISSADFGIAGAVPLSASGETPARPRDAAPSGGLNPKRAGPAHRTTHGARFRF